MRGIRAGLKNLAACAALLTAVTTSALAASERIQGIRIAGAQRISKESVLSRLELKVGMSYDAGKADRSVQALFATTQYKDVQIRFAKGVLTISVVENPLVADVSFSGNAEIKSDKLTAAIKLKKGAIYTDARAHADVLALRDVYRHEGRLASKIDSKITVKPGNRVDVAFEVQEGKVDKVSSISFEGNHAFGAHELEGVIETVRSSWLDVLRSNSIYFPERLDNDRELLRRFYLKHGFADVHVVSAEGKLDQEGKGYAVRFVINEGDRYAFGDIGIEASAKGVDINALRQIIPMQPGDAYDASKIDKTTEAMTLALWKNGERSLRVRPQLGHDESHHRISVTFRIEEGENLTVERIEIFGNTKTRDYVIRREMMLTEGQPFSVFILERDKEHIKALGFFKSVNLEAKHGSSPNSVRVVVNVTEDDTTVLSFGVGLSSEQGVIGDISVEEHNLFGTGRDVKVKLSGSFTELNAELGFSEPHLLGTNAVGGFDLFFRDLDYTEQSSYQVQKVGGDLRIAYPLSDHVTGSLNYTFVRQNIYNVGSAASPAIKEAAAEGAYDTSSIGYALAYDTRDSKTLPRTGTYFILAQDLAGVGGDVRYVKSTADLRTYFPAGDTVTLVSRTTAGNISGWGGDNVRLLDMFYAGGIRGFAPGGIGPRDLDSANLDALGGQNYITNTAEARFDLPFVPEGIGLKGAVFADSGTLFGTSPTVSRSAGIVSTSASLRASVGAGLIWDSPIGALRADYAFPLAKQSYDKTQPFSFGMATF